MKKKRNLKLNTYIKDIIYLFLVRKLSWIPIHLRPHTTEGLRCWVVEKEQLISNSNVQWVGGSDKE